MAKTIYRSSIWSCDETWINQRVTNSLALSTRNRYWWSQQKDEEASRDAAFESNLDGIDDTIAEDMAPHHQRSQSIRHEAPKRIHVLGAGNLGAFVAHSLAGIPSPPPISLLLRYRQLHVWNECDCSIEIISRGMKETRRGFDVETVRRSSEISTIAAEDHSSKRERSLNESKLGKQEACSLDGSASKIGDIFDHNSSILDQSRSVAEDRFQQGLRNDETALGDSGSEASEFSVIQAQSNAGFSQTQLKSDEVQHNKKDLLVSEKIRASDEYDKTIYHLIVSVKAPQTVKALQAIAHRLTCNSSILFLQNGMGVIDEVNDKIFPDKNSRPTYIIGVVSHGLHANRPFSVVHAGKGTIALGVLPRSPMGEHIQLEALNQMSSTARYIMRTMTRTAVLVAVGFSPTDLLQQQLDKLAVNCIINPLTAILDCTNGALLYNFYIERVVRLLLAEISLVIKALPELRNVPNVNMRFDTLRLERLVFSIAKLTAENQSSMVQDIRSARPTEIDYINGYIVKRGEEIGVHCAMNYMLMHMIKAKNKVTYQENADLLPLASQGS